MKKLILIAFMLVAATVQAQTVTATNTGAGVLFKISNWSNPIPPISIVQVMGTIPDYPNGGTDDVAKVFLDHPNWNMYAYRGSDGYCDYKGYTKWYNFATTYYCKTMTFYDGRTDMFVPYNKFDFNYADAGNTVPSDYLFGAGIVSDGAQHVFDIMFNGWNVTKQVSVQVASAAYTIPNCNPAYIPPVVVEPVPLAPTQKKSGGRK